MNLHYTWPYAVVGLFSTLISQRLSTVLRNFHSYTTQLALNGVVKYSCCTPNSHSHSTPAILHSTLSSSTYLSGCYGIPLMSGPQSSCRFRRNQNIANNIAGDSIQRCVNPQTKRMQIYTYCVSTGLIIILMPSVDISPCWYNALCWPMIWC